MPPKRRLKKPAMPAGRELDPRGRPVRLISDPHVMDNLILATGTGASADEVAQYAGISYSTFKEYMMKGVQALSDYNADLLTDRELEENPYFQLYAGIQKERAQTSVRRLARIQQLGMGRAITDDNGKPTGERIGGNWTALAWLQERQDPEHYSQRGRLDVRDDNAITPVEVGGIVSEVIIEHFVGKVPPDVLKAAVADLNNRLKAAGSKVKSKLAEDRWKVEE